VIFKLEPKGGMKKLRNALLRRSFNEDVDPINMCHRVGKHNGHPTLMN
jgi:hypothetical protein